MRINNHLGVTIINLGIIGVIIFAIIHTNSLWPLVGFFCFAKSTSTTVDTECPKCKFKFTATEKGENNED